MRKLKRFRHLSVRLANLKKSKKKLRRKLSLKLMKHFNLC
jgi:hypothetical protein